MERARDRGVAGQLAQVLSIAMGTDELPIRLRAWDGSETGPAQAPVLALNSRRALRRILWSPGQLGLARAFVAGELDVPGDVFAAVASLGSSGVLTDGGASATLPVRDRWRLWRTLLRLGAVGPEPARPAEEIDLSGIGRAHTRDRDAAAISHHYDAGNDFYALLLGPSMVYSCGLWADETAGLEVAQEAKIDLVCRKLGLRPGMRVLDVGCGWGGFALHAAHRYGVEVVGVTLSGEQADLARRRVREAGLNQDVQIRAQDYRDVDDGPFDAIASIGMSEHVGRDEIAGYARHLQELLGPGGRLLNHAISSSAGPLPHDPDSFMSRYVFPDGAVLGLSEVIKALEAAELEVLDVQAMRRHYPLTLRAWAQRLEEHWDEAVDLVGPGRARVWRLYLAAAAWTFDSGRQGVNQVLAQRHGGTPPPLHRNEWM